MFRPSNPSDQHLTMPELKDWERKRDEKKIDFPFIHLSRPELKLLRKTFEEEVKKTDKNASNAIRLRDLDFIRIYTTDFSDREVQTIPLLRQEPPAPKIQCSMSRLPSNRAPARSVSLHALGSPASKGLFSRFSEVMGRHSWLPNSVAGAILSWLMTKIQ